MLYTGYRFGWGERTNGFTLALVGVMAAIVQGGLIRPTVRRLGERRTIVLGLSVACLSFLCYGLAFKSWMLLGTIVLGSLGGLAGPSIQSLVAGTVKASDQGKVQGALTSLMSATASSRRCSLPRGCSVTSPRRTQSGSFRERRSFWARCSMSGL